MTSLIRTIFGAVALSVFGLGANAATYYYSDLVTGDDLGVQNVAILEADQNGDDVDFSLLFSATGVPTGAFLSQIGFSYDGTLPDPILVEELALSEAGVVGTGNVSNINVPGEGLIVDFVTLFESNNSPSSDRLEGGDTALFRIKDMQLSLFDFSPLSSAIRVQGLDNGGSTRYTTGDCVGDDCGGGGGLTPIPVPASLPLLAGALGLGGFVISRRKRKA